MRLFSVVLALATLAAAPAGCRHTPNAIAADATQSRAASVPTPVAKGKLVSVGAFQTTSGTMLVSDPGYPLEHGKPESYQAVIRQAKTGAWRAEALLYKPEPDDERCAELRVFHQSHAHKGPCEWVALRTEVAVDSGQAGIFELAHFHKASDVPRNYRWHDKVIDPTDRWYSLCCDVTLNANAGVIPHGAVASSGYGDGGYTCLVCKKRGTVLGIRLVFISQEDENAQ